MIGQGEGIFHSATATVLIPGLSKGDHDIVAVLGDGAHYRLGSTDAAIFIEVEGPTLSVQGPKEVTSGEAVNLDIIAEGFDGEFLVLVDPPKFPLPAGQVPTLGERDIRTKETAPAISGLAAGEHTIWVVASGPDQAPLAPLVADKIVVKVK